MIRHLLMPLTLSAMAALCAQAVAQGTFPAPLPNQSSNSTSPFPPVNQSGPKPAPSPFPPVNGATSSAPTQASSSSPFPPVNGAAPQPRPSAFPQPSAASAAASQGVFSQGAAPIGGGFGGGPPPGRPSAEQEECLAKFAPLRQDAEKRAKSIQAASARKAGPQEACNLIKGYIQAEAKLVTYVTTKQAACGIPPEIPKQLKENQARSQQMLKAVCTAAAQPQGGAAAPPSLSEVLGASNPAAPEIRSVRRGGSTFDTINGNVLAR